jgi:hypothetical protein
VRIRFSCRIASWTSFSGVKALGKIFFAGGHPVLPATYSASSSPARRNSGCSTGCPVPTTSASAARLGANPMRARTRSRRSRPQGEGFQNLFVSDSSVFPVNIAPIVRRR